MRKLNIINQLGILALLFSLFQGCGNKIEPDRVLRISNPFNNALFFPEFPAPAFEWWSRKQDRSGSYDVKLYTANGKLSYSVTVNQPLWTPRESAWDSIKTSSENEKIYFTVKRFQRSPSVSAGTL
jgi:hypothetical protein